MVSHIICQINLLLRPKSLAKSKMGINSLFDTAVSAGWSCQFLICSERFQGPPSLDVTHEKRLVSLAYTTVKK